MALPQFSMFSFRKDVLWLEIGMGCSALLRVCHGLISVYD